jgi:hypothetical protein
MTPDHSAVWATQDHCSFLHYLVLVFLKKAEIVPLERVVGLVV